MAGPIFTGCFYVSLYGNKHNSISLLILKNENFRKRQTERQILNFMLNRVYNKYTMLQLTDTCQYMYMFMYTYYVT